ncbi:TMEM175 family protein [Lactobacillus selangorensis]|nr:TMEM175 family protein [Lactobacillus selangorensis]
MNKERTAAFTDAVLAIIMTILVLDLKKPATVSWAGLYALHNNFFAYALSFAWLGLMWYSQHNAWQQIHKINNETIVASLVMLFFASFSPYTTSIMEDHFFNVTAQVLYGVVVLLVSLSNIWISHSLDVANHVSKRHLMYQAPDWVTYLDLVIKLVGMFLTVTVYPPAMSYAVLIDILLLCSMDYIGHHVKA